MKKKLNLFVFGKHAILEGIRKKINFKEIFVQKNLQAKYLPKLKDVKCSFKTKEEINLLTKGREKNFVGLISIFINKNINSLLDKKNVRILILDHLEDPLNFGALLRSANAFGFKNIIFPKKRASPLTENVIKVSSGGFIGINFFEVDSIIQTVLKLKKAGFWIYSTGIGENTKKLEEVSILSPLALILGNEGRGISRSILKHSDNIIEIKQKGSVSSLNVANAGAILLHWFDLKLNEEGNP